MTLLTYPNGRLLSYNYVSGLDSTISRLSSITYGSITLEGYTYLGLGTVIERNHPENGVNLTYIGTGTVTPATNTPASLPFGVQTDGHDEARKFHRTFSEHHPYHAFFSFVLLLHLT